MVQEGAEGHRQSRREEGDQEEHRCSQKVSLERSRQETGSEVNFFVQIKTPQ